MYKLKLMQKCIESYRKQALVVILRYSSKAIQEAKNQHT